MKNLKQILANAILLFGFAIAITSCSKDEDASPTAVVVAEVPKSIATIAKATPDLSTLVKALEKAELTATLDAAGTYTVFAPDNKAFAAKYGDGFPSEAIFTKEAVAQILLNHVLLVKKNASDLTTGYVSTMATGTIGTKLSMYVDLTATAGKVTLNGKSKVVTPNIEASNGVIHVVDAIITAPTIIDAATANPSFKTLVSVLTGAGQEATLKVLKDATTASPLTVLAPNDAAFVVALAGWAKNATPAQLTTVLQYHVVVGNNQSKDLTDAQVVTTVGTQKLSVVKTATILKFKDQATDNSTVVFADVQCANGIIHVINGVLQPKL